MRAAAPPPTPLNAATICGMAVIFTMRAAGTATTVPIAIAATINRKCVSPFVAKVTPTARAMPAAPMRLPRLAVFGEVRPRSAKMKQIAAIRSPSRMPVPRLTWGCSPRRAPARRRSGLDSWAAVAP